MKGGVIARNFNSENTYADKMKTLFDFMKQCTCKILTDSSAACITYLFTRTEVNKLSSPSPYISCRNNSMGEDVNSILLKVFIAANESTDKDGNPFFIKKLRSDRYTYEYDDPNKNIPRSHPTTLEELQKEVKMQDYIYKKSFIAPITTCEPICPSIILASDHIIANDSEEHKKFLDSILKNLERRISYQDDQDITKEWFKYKDEKLYIFNKDIKNFEPILGEGETNQKGIMFIAMEMMEEYKTVYDIISKRPSKSTLNYLIYMVLWQFMILSHVIGIKHNDPHGDNIMFNSLNENYFEGYSGQPIIIDFGKTEYLQDRNIRHKFANFGDNFFKEYEENSTNFNVIEKYRENIFNILNVHHKFIKEWCCYLIYFNSTTDNLNDLYDIQDFIEYLYSNYSNSIIIKQLFKYNLDINILYDLTKRRKFVADLAIIDFNKKNIGDNKRSIIKILVDDNIINSKVGNYGFQSDGTESEYIYKLFNEVYIKVLKVYLKPINLQKALEQNPLPIKRKATNNNPNHNLSINSKQKYLEGDEIQTALQAEKKPTILKTIITGGFKKLKTKKIRQRKTKKVRKSKYNKN